jgi:hypothetical protein
MRRQIILALFLFAACGAQAEMRVPAFTAYLDPNPDGARVSARAGISNWKDPALKALWFGEIKTSGQLECSVELRQPDGAESRLRLSVAGK